MELFYSSDINGNTLLLDQQESLHCTKVLRHRTGDLVNVIDGKGNLMNCRIMEIKKDSARLEILESIPGFGSHRYHLTMAVAPTKNIDRFEWFLEKAAEIGVDRIVPVIGEHSERKILKAERCNKILLSAVKQSLKGALPAMEECISLKEFILSTSDEDCSSASKNLKLIAYCGEATKLSIREAVKNHLNSSEELSVTILIGPEGDFSQQEVGLALENGFIPIHLGKSRLRTETAALFACAEIYSILGE